MIVRWISVPGKEPSSLKYVPQKSQFVSEENTLKNMAGDICAGRHGTPTVETQRGGSLARQPAFDFKCFTHFCFGHDLELSGFSLFHF